MCKYASVEFVLFYMFTPPIGVANRESMQGENLNSIEKNMDTAQNYVDRGITHLDKANQYQKKKRKQMCCCMIIALVVIGVILIPVLSVALNNS